MKSKGFDLLEKKHIDTFCEVMNIKEIEINEIYENPGRSANNDSFVFVIGENSYLYRIVGEGTDKFSDRAKEANAYLMLKEYEITDEVIYIDHKSELKITKYYNNSAIPHFDNEEELKTSMMALKHLHSLDIDLGYVDNLFDRANRYYEFSIEVGGAKYFLDGFYKYQVIMNDFKKEYDKANYDNCFIHGDASINNILITKEYDHPLLIDLEFPSMGTPFEDIATFCVDADFREDNIIKMLEYYLEREAVQIEKYYALGLSATAAMMWYGWAAYKCAVEEDNKQFLDFRDDYQKYIEEVYESTKSYKI